MLLGYNSGTNELKKREQYCSSEDSLFFKDSVLDLTVCCTVEFLLIGDYSENLRLLVNCKWKESERHDIHNYLKLNVQQKSVFIIKKSV
jgi:hypothetical protein